MALPVPVRENRGILRCLLYKSTSEYCCLIGYATHYPVIDSEKRNNVSLLTKYGTSWLFEGSEEDLDRVFND